jgi:hypothetical protein
MRSLEQPVQNMHHNLSFHSSTNQERRRARTADKSTMVSPAGAPPPEKEPGKKKK